MLQDGLTGYQIFIRTRARLKSSLYGRHLLALLYGEEASRMMALCKHKSAITWVQRAIKHIKPDLPASLTIEVFRQCCKICVASKLFTEAKALVVYSLKLSEETHGASHPCHAQTLLIYGFYLLNMSDIDESVQVYRQCLDIFLNTLGDVNLKTACARQALGLALFIQGYNQYNFPEALWQIEKSTQILENLLNSKHVFIAASWRLKALLLEGLAANTENEQVAVTNLRQAKKLYWSCVKMSREIVGEMTVQTARYYEHVGKVYRVLGKPHKAEDCLLRAEFIMNHVLEEGSHESLGVTVHIATLYAFDLDKKTYAERLFLKCLRSLREIRGVGVDDFIEMCYRGLLRVTDNRPELQNQYLEWYTEWRDQIQEQHQQTSSTSAKLFNSLKPLLEYVSQELKTSTRHRTNSR
ncbi:amyloid protein-binding protein 2-like [Bolinopsis microptera]|uniref:amyloid protein-binding protein 2-like n=1 Tax=Bolinopsis microptera TaxID=2820187 RepID=UPI00307AC3F0